MDIKILTICLLFHSCILPSQGNYLNAIEKLGNLARVHKKEILIAGGTVALLLLSYLLYRHQRGNKSTEAHVKRVNKDKSNSKKTIGNNSEQKNSSVQVNDLSNLKAILTPPRNTVIQAKFPSPDINSYQPKSYQLTDIITYEKTGNSILFTLNFITRERINRNLAIYRRLVNGRTETTLPDKAIDYVSFKEIVGEDAQKVKVTVYYNGHPYSGAPLHKTDNNEYRDESMIELVQDKTNATIF